MVAVEKSLIYGDFFDIVLAGVNKSPHLLADY